MTLLQRLNQLLATMTFIFCGIALCVMTLIIAWQIFGRFVLNHSPTWSVPLAMLLMTYICLLMAAIGVRERFHLRLWIGIDLVDLHHKKYLLMLNYVIIMLFAACLAYYGGHLTLITWSQAMPILAWPTGVNYIGIAISGIMMLLFALEDFLHLWFNHKDIYYFITHHQPEELEEL